MKDAVIKAHRERLKTHYCSKGVNAREIDRLVDQKIQKLINLRNDDYEDYQRFGRDLIQRLSRKLHRPIRRILDVGCGSGEMIVNIGLAFSNIIVDGVEPYEDEAALSRALIIECGLEGRVYGTVETALASTDEKYDAALFFSVTEHIDDITLARILTCLATGNVECLFILVPNKYKVRDDHTGLPLIPLLPHRVCSFLLSAIRVQYQLSYQFMWDVHYRSAAQYCRILTSTGYRPVFVDDDTVFPSTKLSQKSVLSVLNFRRIRDIKYLPAIIYRAVSERHWMDAYPYLNIVGLRLNNDE